MDTVELFSLTESQTQDILDLMKELDPEIDVTPSMLSATVEAPGTHFFAAIDDSGRVLGCASLCVFTSPTGRKGAVEDVVVGSAARGLGLGRQLMEALIEYARTLSPIDLHLTSRPHRVAANKLYQSLGFRQKETNAYVYPL